MIYSKTLIQFQKKFLKFKLIKSQELHQFMEAS